jgi:hypothetical protein
MGKGNVGVCVWVGEMGKGNIGVCMGEMGMGNMGMGVQTTFLHLPFLPSSVPSFNNNALHF